MSHTKIYIAPILKRGLAFLFGVTHPLFIKGIGYKMAHFSKKSGICIKNSTTLYCKLPKSYYICITKLLQLSFFKQFLTMKETINVNIAQQAFTMDMDAYQTLTAYLDDIGRRLSPTDTETLGDIESRIAEIFRERVPSPMMVITYGVVRSVMNQIGDPELFGEAYRPMRDSNGNPRFPGEEPRKLFRPRSPRSIAGVCSGIANYFSIDVTLVRIIFIVGFFAGFSTGLLYLIMWIAISEEPQQVIKPESNQENKA